MTGYLISNLSVPLHFLKVIDFDDTEGESETSVVSQPIQLFLYITFDYMFDAVTKLETISQIFDQGIPENYADFGKGLC